VYIEQGGGGQSCESYETMLYYYSKYCDLQNTEMPFFFIIGDEGFYDKVSGDHRRKFFGEALATDLSTEKVFEQIKQKFQGNLFLLHLEYKAGDKKVVSQWKKILGENMVLLNDPTLVIETMLGIIAMTMSKRTINTYLDDFRLLYQADRQRSARGGRDDTEDKVKTMRKILEPISKTVNTLARVDVKGGLPAKSSWTLSRRGR
jgi:hypothetical protein